MELNDEKKVLLGLSLDEMKAIVRELGMPAFTAGQILKWLYQQHVTSIDEMTNLSKANRERLKEHFNLILLNGTLHGALVDSHLDHRIAMSLAIAGFACKNPKDTTVIEGAESIAVTYPAFIEDFQSLGAIFYQS